MIQEDARRIDLFGGFAKIHPFLSLLGEPHTKAIINTKLFDYVKPFDSIDKENCTPSFEKLFLFLVSEIYHTKFVIPVSLFSVS